ncbi:hypothetical protein CMEL01_16777 [Colletotrichum melonis]|uniref:Uncharacterized protein n=1 Tax=Colletotrichum melonis TaxID=1209925 RepID=A0AAI9UWP2_9PEZI|nr:hypothetical protein CMEL01_16777 [Colletotrichum melonis]
MRRERVRPTGSTARLLRLSTQWWWRVRCRKAAQQSNVPYLTDHSVVTAQPALQAITSRPAAAHSCDRPQARRPLRRTARPVFPCGIGAPRRPSPQGWAL